MCIRDRNMTRQLEAQEGMGAQCARGADTTAATPDQPPARTPPYQPVYSRCKEGTPSEITAEEEQSRLEFPDSSEWTTVGLYQQMLEHGLAIADLQQFFQEVVPLLVELNLMVTLIPEPWRAAAVRRSSPELQVTLAWSDQTQVVEAERRERLNHRLPEQLADRVHSFVSNPGRLAFDLLPCPWRHHTLPQHIVMKGTHSPGSALQQLRGQHHLWELIFSHIPLRVALSWEFRASDEWVDFTGTFQLGTFVEQAHVTYQARYGVNEETQAWGGEGGVQQKAQLECSGRGKVQETTLKGSKEIGAIPKWSLPDWSGLGHQASEQQLSQALAQLLMVGYGQQMPEFYMLCQDHPLDCLGVTDQEIQICGRPAQHCMQHMVQGFFQSLPEQVKMEGWSCNFPMHPPTGELERFSRASN
eukprot:TRINITY_DN55010_c0_g1_i1.p1 TRINITY_DN55010_c0_g1~~TRINITY_DN55010_c0_g1_i1.p1  ORF type:complete len:415 (-),score=94.45 TRINITY_DN55010_c0_g1_i1:95-1339(-)